MNAHEMLNALQSKFSKSFECYKDDYGLVHCISPADQYLSIAQFLRNDPAWSMEILESLTAVDNLDNITVVSHLYSITHRHWIALKVRLPREEPKVDSLCTIWPAANWFEREVYDLFGVIFTGHPDLRRILLPEEWVGYPLRKDYSDENIIKRPAMAKEPVIINPGSS